MHQRDRFYRFTERARQSLSFAQEEAQHLQQDYIDTEHLLLGLMDIGDGAAIQLLKQLGVDPQKVREAVDDAIARNYATRCGEIGLTPRAKKAIELAVDESRRLFHGNIGTEHLLLGLISEGEGIAAEVLARLGVTLEGTRLATGELAGYPQGEPSAGTAAGVSGGRYELNTKMTPERTRALFERAFAQRTAADIRQVAEHYRLCVAIIQQLLAEREAAGDPPAQQETARAASPTRDRDRVAFGPSEIPQKTPEQMRATMQHLLTTQTPPQLRQMIQTIRQHANVLAEMLDAHEAANGQADSEGHSDV